MDERTNTVLQTIGSAVAKLSSATTFLLEQHAKSLPNPDERAVWDREVQELRRTVGSLTQMLELLRSNQ